MVEMVFRVEAMGDEGTWTDWVYGTEHGRVKSECLLKRELDNR